MEERSMGTNRKYGLKSSGVEGGLTDAYSTQLWPELISKAHPVFTGVNLFT